MELTRVMLAGVGDGEAAVHAALPGTTVFTADEDLLTAVLTCAPDVVILGNRPDLSELLRRLAKTLPTPVVLWSANAPLDDEHPGDVYAVLAPPVPVFVLRQTLRLACAHFIRRQEADEQAALLRAALSERKVIERAKGLLMRARGWSEEDAYMFLRNESRRRRLPTAEVAGEIVRGISGVIVSGEV